MATYNNNNGDQITTNGATYTVINNGVTSTRDLTKWTDNAEQWIDNDIKSGYYEGFVKQN